jgi:hypothetical protein
LLQGLRFDPRHVPDADVDGHAASTTLTFAVAAIEALHAARNILVSTAVAAALRRECVTMLTQRVRCQRLGMHCSTVQCHFHARLAADGAGLVAVELVL